MGVAWTAAGGPHGAKNYNDIVEKYGLDACVTSSRLIRYDAESDAEYWARVEDGFALIASNPMQRTAMMCCRSSHGNTLLSLMHRFAPEGYDLSVRPMDR